jgi:hypothetical protein
MLRRYFLKSTFGAALESAGAFEVRILLEAKYPGGDVRRELAPRGVVLQDFGVVPATFRRNTVLRTGQLVHEPCKRLVGLELRIRLDHHHQSGERAGFSVGARHLLGWRRRAGHLGPGISDGLVDVLLLLRIGLGGFHKVRDQIVPPLQQHLDLAPLSLDGFFLGRELVIRTAAHSRHGRDERRTE